MVQTGQIRANVLRTSILELLWEFVGRQVDICRSYESGIPLQVPQLEYTIDM